jgi:hypothetical protein
MSWIRTGQPDIARPLLARGTAAARGASGGGLADHGEPSQTEQLGREERDDGSGEGRVRSQEFPNGRSESVSPGDAARNPRAGQWCRTPPAAPPANQRARSALRGRPRRRSREPFLGTDERTASAGCRARRNAATLSFRARGGLGLGEGREAAAAAAREKRDMGNGPLGTGDGRETNGRRAASLSCSFGGRPLR